MKGGSRWMPVLGGLMLGVLIGLVLIGLRFGSPWNWPRPERADSSTVTVPGTAEETDTEPMDDPGTGRSNAIVRATREVAPAVVSINVVQRQAVRDPSMEFWERMGLLPQREHYVQSLG